MGHITLTHLYLTKIPSPACCCSPDQNKEWLQALNPANMREHPEKTQATLFSRQMVLIGGSFLISRVTRFSKPKTGTPKFDKK